MISGSNDTIHSWHPGDPDIEALDQFRKAHPEFSRNLLQLSSKSEYKGVAMVFGTGGDFDSTGLEELFNDPVGYNFIEHK